MVQIVRQSVICMKIKYTSMNDIVNKMLIRLLRLYLIQYFSFF